jgi:hypothetical protein
LAATMMQYSTECSQTSVIPNKFMLFEDAHNGMSV